MNFIRNKILMLFLAAALSVPAFTGCGHKGPPSPLPEEVELEESLEELPEDLGKPSKRK